MLDNKIEMTNLLPLSAKKSLKASYRARVILLAAIWFALSASFAVGAVFTAFIHLRTENNRLVREYKLEEEFFLTKKPVDFSKDLKKAREAIRIISGSLSKEQKPLSFLIESFLEMLPSGVTISGIQYAPSADGGQRFRVSVSGEASFRDDLLLFTDRLKKSTLFEKVELPVKYLAKNRDVEFNIMLLSQAVK